MKYHLEITTPDFIPQADMSNTPDLIQFLKAMLPKQIQSFKIRKDGADEIGEFVMDEETVHGAAAIYQKLKIPELS